MASTPVPDADIWVCSACPQKNAANDMVCRTCGEDRPAACPSVRVHRSATVDKNHPAALAVASKTSVSRARRAAPLAGGSGWGENSSRKHKISICVYVNFLYVPHIELALYVAHIENLHTRIKKMVIFCVYTRERAKEPPNSEAYADIEKKQFFATVL